LKQSENVGKLAGSQLIATYKMKLTAEVNPDDLVNNSAQVTIGNNPQDKIHLQHNLVQVVINSSKKIHNLVQPYLVRNLS
jgi:hypothetical protein